MKKHWYLLNGDELRAKYFRGAFFWGDGWFYQYGIQQKRKKEIEEKKIRPVAVSTAPVYYDQGQPINLDKKSRKNGGQLYRIFQFLRNFRLVICNSFRAWL